MSKRSRSKKKSSANNNRSAYAWIIALKDDSVYEPKVVFREVAEKAKLKTFESSESCQTSCDRINQTP